MQQNTGEKSSAKARMLRSMSIVAAACAWFLYPAVVSAFSAPNTAQFSFASRYEPPTSTGFSTETVQINDVVEMAEDTLVQCFEAAEKGADLHNPARLRRIELAMERLFRTCRQFEYGSSEEESDEARRIVRTILKPFVGQGPFGKEVTTWPRGPGSTTAMRLLYEGINLPTHTALAHYSEWYLRTADLGHAVRARKNALRQLLHAELLHQAGLNNRTIRVLDLANGPIQSLKEIVQSELVSRGILERVFFRGYDTDGVTQLENDAWIKENQAPGTYLFHAADTLRLPFTGEAKSSYNNIVYSTGFFDYLPDSMLKKLWKKCYDSLKPDGALIISLKDCNMYEATVYHYLCHWDQFFQRNEEHFLDLLGQCNLKIERAVRDDTGIILFYVVRKTL